MAPPLQYASASEFDSFTMPSNAFASVPTAIKDIALQWASGIANGYIRKRKVLPLVSWDVDLKAQVCELAGWYLTSRRGFKPLSGSNETIRLRYDDAIAWLLNVSLGNVELANCVDSSTTPDVDEAGPLAASDTLVNWNYQTRGPRRGGYYGGGFDGDGLG